MTQIPSKEDPARWGSLAFEKHNRVKELARLWGMSAKTAARLFADDASVIRIVNDLRGTPNYATLSIAESAASRVHERLALTRRRIRRSCDEAD